MKLTHTVNVDYDELAEYLCLHYNYSLDDKDSPLLPSMSFEYFREVVDQHVEDLMDADSFASDTGLTEILLRRHTFGSIANILVTRSPGYVVNNGKRKLVLPLIILEIDY